MVPRCASLPLTAIDLMRLVTRHDESTPPSHHDHTVKRKSLMDVRVHQEEAQNPLCASLLEEYRREILKLSSFAETYKNSVVDDEVSAEIFKNLEHPVSCRNPARRIYRLEKATTVPNTSPPCTKQRLHLPMSPFPLPGSALADVQSLRNEF